jgi:hypothetical protein
MAPRIGRNSRTESEIPIVPMVPRASEAAAATTATAKKRNTACRYCRASFIT